MDRIRCRPPFFVCQRRNLYVTLFAKRFAEKLR